MVTFDEKGHVYPYVIIEMTIGEFEKVFVNELEDKNRRKELFDNYLQFLEDLKKEFPLPFYQWIDGSFTTQKKLPGDIDVVSFINYDHFIKKPGVINYFAMHGKKLYQVDAHFATTASWRHRFFQKTKEEELYWQDVFGTTRRDENQNRQQKGIIKININKT